MGLGKLYTEGRIVDFSSGLGPQIGKRINKQATLTLIYCIKIIPKHY
jgi:hypothetical protein